jgi:hypothetical protein
VRRKAGLVNLPVITTTGGNVDFWLDPRSQDNPAWLADEGEAIVREEAR